MSQKYSEDYDIEWETPDQLRRELEKELKSLDKNVLTRNRPKNKKRIKELTEQIEDLKSFEVKKNTVSKCEGDGNNLIETTNFCIRRITYRGNEQFFDIRPTNDEYFCKVKDIIEPKRPTREMKTASEFDRRTKHLDEKHAFLQIKEEIERLWEPCMRFLMNLKNVKVKKSIIQNFVSKSDNDIFISFKKTKSGTYECGVLDQGNRVDKLMLANGLEFYLLTVRLSDWGTIGHQCIIISEEAGPSTYNIIVYDPSGAFSKNKEARETLLRYLREKESPRVTYNYLFDFDSGKYSIQFGPTCMLYSWKLFVLLCLNGPKIKQGRLSSLTLIDYLRDQSNEQKKQLIGTLYSMLYFIEVYDKLIKKINPSLKKQFVNTNNDICGYLENVGCQIPEEFYLDGKPEKSSPKKSSLSEYVEPESVDPEQEERNRLRKLPVSELEELAKKIGKPWKTFETFDSQSRIGDGPSQVTKKDFLVVAIARYTMKKTLTAASKKRIKKTKRRKAKQSKAKRSKAKQRKAKQSKAKRISRVR